MTGDDFRQVLDALRLARGYVERVHGNLAGVLGHYDTVVKPDLDKIDAAIRILESKP